MSTSVGHRQPLDEDVHDPYSEPHIYYGKQSGRPRTSSESESEGFHGSTGMKWGHTRTRRASLDIFSHHKPRQFMINVAKTLKHLEDQEDTDRNFQITIEDGGPKVISLGTYNSNGHNKYDIRGTYQCANLMQELTLANDYGRKHVLLDEARVMENPVARLHRLIRTTFWSGLTRRIDASVIESVTKDPKAERMKDHRPRIYIPYRETDQFEYYKKVAKNYPDLNLDVVRLPELIDANYTKSINDKPGLLALAMEKYIDEDGKEDLRGYPFVVPGGRFNELYGWDSYMISLGLLENKKVDLARSMVINFCFEIEHYGKILNANRSYYLSRSQPPFLTDMAIKVFEKIQDEPSAIEFLRTSTLAAIKEYFTVWMAHPRYDPETGLSRYRPDGIGVPPETEPSHFDSTLSPYAKKHNMSIDDFITAYNDGIIKEPALDEYFLHDRAVRESGHDTSYRLEGICANLATIDLNSLLYKYEKDISRIIKQYFNDKLSIPKEFSVPGHEELKINAVFTSDIWEHRATKRKELIDKYLWNETKGMYFDYDTVQKRQINYETATVFWALWSGVADEKQAEKLVKIAIPKFEEHGGLASGTKESRGELSIDRPNRQWDYPYGWAPQQMLAWVGLVRYGYHQVAMRLAYRWLHMITTAFVDYHGTVVEKYDVTRPVDPHRVDAEYGNQGIDFTGVAREGFGWVNASFEVGRKYLDSHALRALGALVPPGPFFSAIAKNKNGQFLEHFGASPQSSLENSPQTSPDVAVKKDPFETMNKAIGSIGPAPSVVC